MWITAEKVDMSVKKRFSHHEVGKSSEKRGFYISFPKKMFTLHYAILCTTMDLSGSSLHYAIYISYIFLVTKNNIIFSPSFFGFSSAIFFSISIYCGFTSFYHYAALVVPFYTWLCFFLFSFVLLM